MIPDRPASQPTEDSLPDRSAPIAAVDLLSPKAMSARSGGYALLEKTGPPTRSKWLPGS